MGIEIERKFLVKNPDILDSLEGREIRQGYMPVSKGIVRIRTWGDEAFITLKGRGLHKREEYEYPIPHTDAVRMIELFCDNKVICKTRYLLNLGDHLWEIDRFYDENEGLIIAEIELNHEDEYVEKPDWLGKEVTGESRYYNSQLLANPYVNWHSQ